MKSHARLKAEAKVERYFELIPTRDGDPRTDDDMIYHGPDGDFLIEVKAHYLGSKSRLKEPLVD